MERRGRKGGDLLHNFRGAARRPVFNSSKQTLRFGITQTTLGGLLYTSSCKFPVSVVNVSLSKSMNMLVNIRQLRYCNNTEGDVCIGPIVYSCFDITTKEVAKMPKNTRFQR